MTLTICAYCKNPMNPGATGAYREVLGWTMQRKQGGANKIGLQRETGRYMHGMCFDRMNVGIHPDQGTLA